MDKISVHQHGWPLAFVLLSRCVVASRCRVWIVLAAVLLTSVCTIRPAASAPGFSFVAMAAHFQIGGRCCLTLDTQDSALPDGGWGVSAHAMVLARSASSTLSSVRSLLLLVWWMIKICQLLRSTRPVCLIVYFCPKVVFLVSPTLWKISFTFPGVAFILPSRTF